MLRQWDRGMECPLCVPVHTQSTIYSVYISSPDASTPGLLQGDPAFCSQGVPYRIVPVSVLEVLRGENLFPPGLYDLWSRTGTKTVLLNWGFRSSPFPENVVHEMALILIHCFRWRHGAAETWTSCSLCFIHCCWYAEWVACTSLGHRPMTKSIAGNDHSPIIAKGSWNRKQGCMQQYFRGWGASAGNRGGSEHVPAQEEDWKHPWGLVFVFWCNRHLLMNRHSVLMNRNCLLFGNKSEFQNNPLNDFCKGTAGATWA